MEKMIQWANLVMQARQAAPPTHQPARAAASAHNQPQELPAREHARNREIDRSLTYLWDYSRQRPPPYEGQINGLKAEEWLLQTEKILDALRIPDDGERVRLAAYSLTDGAYMWWISIKNTRSVQMMTWDEFVSLFLERHFPDTDREAYQIELTNLKQEEMTVSEYASKFIQLSHYAPYLVLTEAEKARQFQLCLRPQILNQMLTHRFRNMALCMNEALVHERWVAKGKRMRDDSATAGGDHRPSKKAASQPFRASTDKPTGSKKPQPTKTDAARPGISIR